MSADQEKVRPLNDIILYFCQLNSIAKRISFDINRAKCDYGKHWEILNCCEKNKIINKALIQPGIKMAYIEQMKKPSSHSTKEISQQTDINTRIDSKEDSLESLVGVFLKNPMNKTYFSSDFKCECYSKAFVRASVQHDSHSSYRDEHSVPFSFHTKSQTNLFDSIDLAEDMDNNAQKLKGPIKNAPEYENQNKTESKLQTNSAKFNKIEFVNIKLHSSEKHSKLFEKHFNKDTNPGDDLEDFLYTKKKESSFSSNHTLHANGYFNKIKEKTNLRSSESLISFSVDFHKSDDDDEDNISEEVKLLESGSNLKKRFEFLNNW